MHPIDGQRIRQASTPTQGTTESIGQSIYRRPKSQDSIFSSPVSALKETVQPTPSPLFAAPKLKAPDKVNFHETKLLTTIDDIYGTGQRLTDALNNNIRQATAKLKDLTIEKMHMLEAAAKKTQSSEFWGILRKVGECILAAFTAIMGMTLVSTGPVALGAVMIASGILSVVNFTMRESGAWDSVAKKLAKDVGQEEILSRYLPLGVSLVTAVLSIGGGAATTLWTAASMTQKAFAIAQASLGIYNGATGAGKAIVDAKIAWSQAELTAKESEITQNRIRVDMKHSQMAHTLKIIEQIQQAAESVVELYAQAIKRTTLHI